MNGRQLRIMFVLHLAIDKLSKCVGRAYQNDMDAYQNRMDAWTTEEADGFAGLCSDCIDCATDILSDKIESSHDSVSLDVFKTMLDVVTSFLGDINTGSSDLEHNWNVEHLCRCIHQLVMKYPPLKPDVHRCTDAFLALYIRLESLTELCGVCHVDIPADHPLFDHGSYSPPLGPGATSTEA